MFSKTTRLLLCTGALISLSLGGASAQTVFPEPGKPVTLMSGFAPGGIAGRSMQDFQPFFERELGGPVVVETVEGAAGLIAYNSAFGRPADGHTMLLASGTYGPHLYPHLSQTELPWSYEDWVPLGIFSDTPSTGITVLSSSAIVTFPDLVAAAKADPGGITVGTVGPGRIEDIQILELQSFFGIELNHVYYDSGSTLLTDLLTGDLDAIMSAAVGYVGNPDVRIVTLLAKEIPPEFPHKDLNTMANWQEELNYDVADLKTLISTLSNGLVVKAGLPDDVYQRLVVAFRNVVNDPEWQAKVGEYREPVYYPPERAKEIYDNLNVSIAAMAAAR